MILRIVTESIRRIRLRSGFRLGSLLANTLIFAIPAAAVIGWFTQAVRPSVVAWVICGSVSMLWAQKIISLRQLRSSAIDPYGPQRVLWHNIALGGGLKIYDNLYSTTRRSASYATPRKASGFLVWALGVATFSVILFYIFDAIHLRMLAYIALIIPALLAPFAVSALCALAIGVGFMLNGLAIAYAYVSFLALWRGLRWVISILLRLMQRLNALRQRSTSRQLAKQVSLDKKPTERLARKIPIRAVWNALIAQVHSYQLRQELNALGRQTSTVRSLQAWISYILYRALRIRYLWIVLLGLPGFLLAPRLIPEATGESPWFLFLAIPLMAFWPQVVLAG